MLKITEQRFGRLVAISPTSLRMGPNVIWWLICDCGEYLLVPTNHLTDGHTKSCGCLRQDITAERFTKHGCNRNNHKVTREYRTWYSMKTRCFNTKTKDYKNYGGRGITVCGRWMRFENFLEDTGQKPRGMTIDRINNDGNYEPGNWRWATMKEQANNKRQ